MKGLSVVLVLVVLVAGVAVRGSLAQPLTLETSDAYRNCIGKVERHPPIVLDRCRPAGDVVVAQTEFEANFDAVGGVGAGEAGAGIGAGGDVAGGERWLEAARAGLQALLNLLNVLNALQIVGGGLPEGMQIAHADTLFDPVR